MTAIKKRYDVVAGQPYTDRDGNAKKRWLNVGRLTEWDDGGLSIELHTVPTGNWFDGRLSVFEQKEKEQQGGARQERPKRQAATDEGSDIPF